MLSSGLSPSSSNRRDEREKGEEEAWEREDMDDGLVATELDEEDEEMEEEEEDPATQEEEDNFANVRNRQTPFRNTMQPPRPPGGGNQAKR